jgi:hypothetical protein
VKLDLDTIIAVLLSGTATPGARRSALQCVRRHAEQRLHAACERVGITVDDLADNDRAVVANLLFQKAGIERSERAAALLMRWCVEAEERGYDPLIATRIVQALRNMEKDLRSEQQRKRRKGKPASSDGDASRNKRIVRFHARLTKAGRGDATSATAAEFGLSTRTIRRILRS